MPVLATRSDSRFTDPTHLPFRNALHGDRFARLKIRLELFP